MPKDAHASLTISWRIGVPHYETDRAFADLLELIGVCREWLDEVAFFETLTHHLYLPLDSLAARAAVLKRRIEAVRAEGIERAGINILTTMGHINEAWDSMPALPFQPMVGHDGSVSRGCACPNTPELREYVQAKYALFAEAGPDFIWVDDDIRMNHHGVAWACFCPTCLRMVSERLGVSLDREALLAALDDPSRSDARAAWIAHNADTIDSLMAHVAAAAHAVNPSIAMGLMTAGPGDLYSGAELPRWMRSLTATKLRPGGGFYTDATPGGMVDKALDVGRGSRVVRDMPEIADIQYELENFPYQRLRKSATALISECTLALATGCNGVALNMLPMWGGPFDEVDAFVERLPRVRPEWEQLVEAAAGLPTAGLWPAWHDKVHARRPLRAGESWLGSMGEHGTSLPYVLSAIGIPLSVEPWGGDAPPAFGAVLGGRAAEAFTDDELRVLLSGGVLMDTAALDILAARGLGELTGVRIARRIDNGAMEQFTDDALNGEHAGQIRDARIEFWGDARGKADVLEPLADGVRILADIHDYFRWRQGPCLSAYENELGGRVAVAGYAQWMFLQSVSKRAQLLNIADWLTGGALPARVDEPVPLIPFVRMAEDRSRAVVVLLNAGLDAIERATVRIRLAGGEQVRQVDELAAWATTVLRAG